MQQQSNIGNSMGKNQFEPTQFTQRRLDKKVPNHQNNRRRSYFRGDAKEKGNDR
jgi:hypothetical protein